MKTLDEVITGLEVCSNGQGCENCPYAVYDEDGFEQYLDCEKMNTDALHYLKALRYAKTTLEAEKERYQEAVKNCEEAENKYKMLSGKLDGFPTADVRKNLRY